MEAPKELYVTANKGGLSWQGTEYKRSHGLIYIPKSSYDALEKEAREIIERLLDVQNGCPLPKYEKLFNESNEMARGFLAKHKEGK